VSVLFRFALRLFPRPLLIRVSQWLYPLLDLWYRGKGFTDPINGKSYRKFLPYGYQKQRSNVLSPGTLSLERHRLLWLYFDRETDFFDCVADVLHIAPEQAFVKRFKKLNHRSYVTSDLHSPIADVQADICNLPFSDEQFDWVVCNHVLEHIANDKIAMQEIYRVLKPGGTAILQVPLRLDQDTFEDNRITDPKERARIFGQYDHIRIYGKDYQNRLEQVGFTVKMLAYAEQLTLEEQTRYAVPANEIIPVCTKAN
jgi:SAM-dependent methyltransferase